MAGLFAATFVLNVCSNQWKRGMVQSIAIVDVSLSLAANVAILNRSMLIMREK
jgi:hypothetical protein